MRIGTKIGGSDKNQDVYLGIFFGDIFRDDFSKISYVKIGSSAERKICIR